MKSTALLLLHLLLALLSLSVDSQISKPLGAADVDPHQVRQQQQEQMQSQYNGPQFPDLEGNISGDNYPPPDWAVWIAQFTGILQLAGMAFMMFGDGIWDSLGGQPGWWNEVKDNKMPVFVGLFLMNSMANSQLSTGAFEIFYNGDLVFSKLAMGRMPSGREVLLTINGMRGA